jgi:4'-phosphopantetheinyl transferase
VFQGAGHRRDYIVTHTALRYVLGQCVGIEPASVRFAAGGAKESIGGQMCMATSKPALASAFTAGLEIEGKQRDIRFNLSHTRGAALIGVALGRELGVDIEWQRPIEDLEDMARAVMSAEELSQWHALEEDDRASAFYHVWARKEAYLKAIGLGLFRSLQEITVPVSANPLGSLRETGERGWPVSDRAGGNIWTVADVEVCDGYSAAICCEGADLPALVLEDLHLDSIRHP